MIDKLQPFRVLIFVGLLRTVTITTRDRYWKCERGPQGREEVESHRRVAAGGSAAWCLEQIATFKRFMARLTN